MAFIAGRLLLPRCADKISPRIAIDYLFGLDIGSAIARPEQPLLREACFGGPEAGTIASATAKIIGCFQTAS